MCQGFRENYVAWRDALGPAPSSKHSVDRKNNNGHYSCGRCSQCTQNHWPLNIHWQTSAGQNDNKRSNQIFPWKGRMLNITQIARMENVAFCSLRNRLIQGKMPVSVAIQDLRQRGLTFNERAKAILERNASHVPNN
jgi:hypothetical protein